MGWDQTNKDEQIIVYVTLIQNLMMEEGATSLQGDQTLGKYLTLLGINRSSIDIMVDTKKSCKKCPLTFASHQHRENTFLVERLVDSYFILCLIQNIIEVWSTTHSCFS